MGRSRTSRSAPASAGSAMAGCAVGDYDEHGHDDLFVTGLGSTLYSPEPGRRDVRGHDRAGRSVGSRFSADGVGGSATPTATAKDLVVVTYARRRPDVKVHLARRQRQAGSTRLPGRHPPSATSSANVGTARSRRSAASRPPTSLAATAWARAIADLDDDGKLDLFVANDAALNFLFRNLGGLIEEIKAAWGRLRLGYPRRRAWGSPPRTSTAMADRPVPYQFHQRAEHAPAPNLGGGLFQDEIAWQGRARSPPGRPSAGSGRWSTTPTTTACSTCSSPTVTSTTARG